MEEPSPLGVVWVRHRGPVLAETRSRFLLEADTPDEAPPLRDPTQACELTPNRAQLMEFGPPRAATFGPLCKLLKNGAYCLGLPAGSPGFRTKQARRWTWLAENRPRKSVGLTRPSSPMRPTTRGVPTPPLVGHRLGGAASGVVFRPSASRGAGSADPQRASGTAAQRAPAERAPKRD
jgi:hypothetical protein